MLGDLGAFTLRSIKTMIQFSSLSSIKPAMLPASMLGATLRVRLRRPLVFLVVLTCWEICFLSRRYSTYLFLLFWIIIPAILPPRCSDTTL
jgi:hypothetical protein